jgi:guanylate kinase
MSKGIKMSKKLLIVFGKSGSGKSYICRAFGLNRVISHTTRPKRPHELEGEDYYFISKDTYDKIPEESKVAETTFNGNKYFTLIGELVRKDAYIVDMCGVTDAQEYLKKYEWDIDVTVIYIHCNLLKRLYRMVKRGDGIFSAFKRALHDYKHFKDVDYHFIIKT